MLRGSASISLDAKGRMAIPARYRERLQESTGAALVLTLAFRGHCLLLYPMVEWEQIERRLVRLSDLDEAAYRLKHTLLGNAHECEPDANGRILLPTMLREVVAIDRQVQMVGLGNKFEIWSQPVWEEQLRSNLLAASQGEMVVPKELTSIAL